MGLNDGPLIVGWDFATGTGDIWQIVDSSTNKVHTETPQGSHQLRFLDGVYWPEDGGVYIVGRDAETINGQKIHGVIWRWDGTTLTVDKTFTAQGALDRRSVTTIVLFNDALYVGICNIISNSPNGFQVWKKATPAGAWAQVYSSSSTSFEGAKVLREDNSTLILLPKKASGSGTNPAGYYYTTDGSSWSVGDAVDGDLDPSFLFWDSGNSEWRWGGDSGPPATIDEYTASALDGVWSYQAQLGMDTGAGEIGIGDSVWYTQFGGPSMSSKWDGQQWSKWFDLTGVITVGYESARATPRYTLGAWYTPTVEFNAGQGTYYKDTTRYLYGGAWSAGSGLVPTELPDTWDILQIEPRKWGSGPFCDETENGTTVYAGSHLEIDGSLGLDTPAYYDLQFGSTCSSMPNDWDMQLDMELTNLPALHSVVGPRLVLSTYNPTTERKVSIQISKQGVGIYGLDTYSDLRPSSNFYTDDDTVTVKITVLTDSSEDRAYLSIVKGGASYRVGFPSYEKSEGATGRIRIEAYGTPQNPVRVNLQAVRLRDHAFDPVTDPDSIDVTKPVAEIV